MDREDIIREARSLIGTRYRHQGRSADTGVDCVGLLSVIADRLGYPHSDLTTYRRTPQPSVLIGLLKDNLEEIPLEELVPGDIVLMTAGGRKPRHTAIIVSDELDPARGKVPTLIHAISRGTNRVVECPVDDWAQYFVKGFKMRGVV